MNKGKPKSIEIGSDTSAYLIGYDRAPDCMECITLHLKIL